MSYIIKIILIYKLILYVVIRYNNNIDIYNNII
jgi:hypothetical protein